VPDHDFPPVLTAAMAAELLCVHVEHLRRLVRDGKVPVHAFPDGRELRFLRDELLEWLGALPPPAVRRRQPDDVALHAPEAPQSGEIALGSRT
jgi:excisionase family DNA binding protein